MKNKYDIFISYSRSDIEVVSDFVRCFEKAVMAVLKETIWQR